MLSHRFKSILTNSNSIPFLFSPILLLSSHHNYYHNTSTSYAVRSRLSRVNKSSAENVPSSSSNSSTSSSSQSSSIKSNLNFLNPNQSQSSSYTNQQQQQDEEEDEEEKYNNGSYDPQVEEMISEQSSRKNNNNPDTYDTNTNSRSKRNPPKSEGLSQSTSSSDANLTVATLQTIYDKRLQKYATRDLREFSRSNINDTHVDKGIYS